MNQTISLTKTNGTWAYLGDDNGPHRFLLQDDVRFAWIVVDYFVTPEGHHRVVIEPENLPDGLAPMQMITCVSKLIPAPDGWQDAPPRPSCRGGRFDGAAQDEAATAEWMAAARRWHIEHRQPLLAKLRLGLTA